MLRWGSANASTEEERRALLAPVLEHVRYPYMSVEKLKNLASTNEVPHPLIFDALFFKLHHSGPDDPSQFNGRYRPRTGSLLFSWMPTGKVTVSGEYRENARHTSANGFTGVRGDRRMQHGVYSWTIDICETQSSWIFVGVARADDLNDVAWRSSGHMLYCLDSRYFHQGSGQNHPSGDRKINSGDCIRVVLDCTQRTLAFGVNKEKLFVLFRDLEPVPYVPAVDLRDCGDKVRILSSSPHLNGGSVTRRGSALVVPVAVRQTAAEVLSPVDGAMAAEEQAPVARAPRRQAALVVAAAPRPRPPSALRLEVAAAAAWKVRLSDTASTQRQMRPPR
eukprot:CAMPEP_0177526318 /NCGR_PEP_ID=MMETSP0369-20130122/51025_1 /TAXON_ID=447022 ORGANISM="Scrippsiella hangoei-like, Strain SHHI-4" /NCGR_SAMPLE_ID=MMETSP0369 /ASSEMBLY_ACC=CAM_ASM_000364 /LENGTH=334 /DNA_ID=CAMNT_0019006545 /DNA_START=15 /DNA_END=1015 /DNA_ORIENTATION=-